MNVPSLTTAVLDFHDDGSEMIRQVIPSISHVQSVTLIAPKEISDVVEMFPKLLSVTVSIIVPYEYQVLIRAYVPVSDRIIKQ